MTRDEADAIRIAANENLLRERNEQLKAVNAVHVWVNPPFPDWTCECGDATCSDPIRVSIEEYEAIRAKQTRFRVAPGAGHIAPDVERIVQRDERFWVVEKVGVGVEMRKELDPRASEQKKLPNSAGPRVRCRREVLSRRNPVFRYSLPEKRDTSCAAHLAPRGGKRIRYAAS